MIKPFVLRRLKTDPTVAADLPDKIEQVHACELTDLQKSLYETVLEQKEKMVAESLEAEEDKPGEALRRRGRILAILHALREVCNHPANLKPTRRPEDFKLSYPARDDWDASGKCAVLQSLLDGILTGGDKVLIFCNYLETIKILCEQIQAAFKDCQPLVFTGEAGVEERTRLVDTFQNDPSRQVMILSIQAGGVGITLTAATHVIHFDRCYNPAKENQATDRAHRIGQTKTVFVHRLTTLNTFEEKLAAIMAQKQSLSDLTLQGGDSWIADLGADELRNLFKLSGSKDTEDAEDGEPAPKRRRAEPKDSGEAD